MKKIIVSVVLVCVFVIVFISCEETKKKEEANPSPQNNHSAANSTNASNVSTSVSTGKQDQVAAKNGLWYMQLNGKTATLVTNHNVKYYDVDVFDVSAEVISNLKKSGKFVICYLNAGAWENWRSDANALEKVAIGAPYEGWEGEFWMDIRRESVKNYFLKRLDLAVSKGCDGIDPDNVCGFEENTGFSGITQDDQIKFNSFLEQETHKKGLKIGMKNCGTLSQVLAPKFDWVVTEEIFQKKEYNDYLPYVQNKKMVFAAEYYAFDAKVCSLAKTLGMSVAFFNLELDGKQFDPCP